jgi:ferredoxin
MRIKADTEACVGAGQCVLTDPDTFDQSDDDGTVVLRTEHVTGEALERARTAVNLCPGLALSLTDD